MYTKKEIKDLNTTKLWNNSIKTAKESETDEYILYSTGDANLTNGRIYISLPKETKLTNSIKKSYNIL